VVENGDGVDSGDCSPAIEIVEAGTPELDSVSPEGALPGRQVKIEGTDLAPMGPCAVIWTDSAGKSLKALGFSNGYDEIRSYVPFQAEAGATYEIVALLRGDVKTSGVVKYEVGSYADPEIEGIDPDEGPAGSLVRIKGTGFLTFDSKPKVFFTADGESTAAKVYGAVPGIGDRPDQLLAVVPRDLADGEYDVTVTVEDDTSDAVTFTVETPSLYMPDPACMAAYPNPNTACAECVCSPMASMGCLELYKTCFENADPMFSTLCDGITSCAIAGKCVGSACFAPAPLCQTQIMEAATYMGAMFPASCQGEADTNPCAAASKLGACTNFDATMVDGPCRSVCMF
jgi:hypothetical protein